jgi:hypothetical protein
MDEIGPDVPQEFPKPLTDVGFTLPPRSRLSDRSLPGMNPLGTESAYRVSSSVARGARIPFGVVRWSLCVVVRALAQSSRSGDTIARVRGRIARRAVVLALGSLFVAACTSSRHGSGNSSPPSGTPLSETPTGNAQADALFARMRAAYAALPGVELAVVKRGSTAGSFGRFVVRLQAGVNVGEAWVPAGPSTELVALPGGACSVKERSA